MVVEVVAFGYDAAYLADAGLALAVKLDCSRRGVLGEVDALKVDVAFRGGCAALSNALDGNLLHQVLVVGLHGIQAVDHVVDAVVLVGCRVAQRQERHELR